MRNGSSVLITPVSYFEIDKFEDPPEEHGNEQHAEKLLEAIGNERVASELVHQCINDEDVPHPDDRKIPISKGLDLEDEIQFASDD